MKTTNDLPIVPEEKPAKSNLFFTALAFSALAVSAVGGGAAFMIYHQFSSMPAGTPVATTPGAQTEHLATVPMARPAAVQTEDRSDYRRVDNTVLRPAEARRVIAAWRSNPVVSTAPPPLTKTADEVSQGTGNRPPLTDPDSHYIVSASTGRVIGVDGSAGAAAEMRRAQAVPVAVAVQTPPPEVRVASAVQVRAAVPVVSGDEDTLDPQNSGFTNGVQVVPVRRAQSVATGRNFNAASYLAAEDDRLMSRAQAVVTPASRDNGYRHDFRLPDFSNR